ncbi:MAG TPA: hypothetical protein VIK91_23200 [Nannocystis sp.]
MRPQRLALLVGWFLAGMGAGLTCDVAALIQPPAGDEPSTEPQDEPDEEAEELCAGFQQPGCVHTGCPEGQVCRIGVECVPTLCSCDPETGQSLCSLDCEGGTCVDGTRDCPKIACRLLCTFGRARDEDGCEVCRCREAPECPCTSDDECVKVTTGCCPCEQGGVELAISRVCMREIAQCPVAPEAVPCLAFDRCTDRQARCVAGRCVLQNAL